MTAPALIALLMGVGFGQPQAAAIAAYSQTQAGTYPDEMDVLGIQSAAEH